MSENDPFSRNSKLPRTPTRSNNNNNGLTNLLNVSNHLATLNNRTNDSGLENTNQNSNYFESSTASAQQWVDQLINFSTENSSAAGNRSVEPSERVFGNKYTKSRRFTTTTTNTKQRINNNASRKRFPFKYNSGNRNGIITL